MAIFSWGSERARLEGHRRICGHALPLALWVLVPWFGLFERVRRLDGGWSDVVVAAAWVVSILVLDLSLRPLAVASVASTARWQGRSPDELEAGRGVRGFLGLTEAEPWWVTWSILACWVSLPVLLVFLGALLGLGHAMGKDAVPALLGGAVGGGILVAFLLAPVVRAWSGQATAAGTPARAEGAGQDAAG